MYFVLNRTVHRLWKGVIVYNSFKEMSKLLHKVLEPFMITARVRLRHFEKPLITETGARQSSN